MKTILVIATLNGFLIAFMVTQFSNPQYTNGLIQSAEILARNVR